MTTPTAPADLAGSPHRYVPDGVYEPGWRERCKAPGCELGRRDPIHAIPSPRTAPDTEGTEQ